MLFRSDLRLNITKFCHEFESLLTHWIQTQGGSRNALPHLLVSRILKIFALLLENLDGRLNGDSVPHPTLRLDGCYEGFKKWKEGKPVCPDSILDPRMAPLGTDTLIKLPFTRLDQLVEEVHSLQLMVGKVQERFSNQNSVKQSLKPVLEGLNRLQTRVLDSRLFPIGLVFDRFLRTIRDHGHTLNKEVGCEIRGSDIQIDQNTANILSIPMTHLVRNSLDHGIESPTLRKTLGKPLPGLISFAAMQSSNRLIIEISDDGQGIHSDLSAAQDNNALLHNLTQLGYSSKAYITPNSGRGIGLYVAKREIEKHGGCLKLESKNGEFTKFTIELPLRFFVTDCILFRSDKQIFAVPLDHLQTVSSVEEYGTQDAEKNVKSLSKLINPSSQGLQENFDLELFNSQKETFHLRVEECLGKESLLIRSMDNPFLQSLPLTSAASVLHNGKLCWILDPNRLGIQKTERKYHLIQNTPENHDPHLDRIFSGANRGRVLCFQAGEKLYAIPLFYLKEVMDYKKPIRLPILPELILGLISLRGLPIPLVNLLALVSQYAANNEFECILILEHNGALTGIPTGKLSGIHTLQRQHLFFSHKSLSMPVIGSFKLRNSEVNLLNLEALIGQGINCCNNLDLGDES